MPDANLTLIDLELRGLVQRAGLIDDEEAYVLTHEGHEVASQVLASLSAEDFVLISMLLGHLLTKANP